MNPNLVIGIIAGVVVVGILVAAVVEQIHRRAIGAVPGVAPVATPTEVARTDTAATTTADALTRDDLAVIRNELHRELHAMDARADVRYHRLRRWVFWVPILWVVIAALLWWIFVMYLT